MYVQLSVSSYSDHSANIKKILTKPKIKCEELKDKSFDCYHEYYKTFAEKFHVKDTIYFYVSTSTVCDGFVHTYKLMEEHANKAFKVGIICKTSTIYKTFINLGC